MPVAVVAVTPADTVTVLMAPAKPGPATMPIAIIKDGEFISEAIAVADLGDYHPDTTAMRRIGVSLTVP